MLPSIPRAQCEKEGELLALLSLSSTRFPTRPRSAQSRLSPFLAFPGRRRASDPARPPRLATGPFFWIASIGHWLLHHFDLKKFKPNQRPAVQVSLAAVTLFGLGVLVPLTVIGGPAALVKYWFLPWLGFHFWMSTFTIVHHTAPHIEWHPNSEWRAVAAQLGGTVHCEYPRWVDFLTHDISVHIGHHLSTKIPWYHLRTAYASLRQNWGPYLQVATFGLPLMQTITRRCGLWDPEAFKWRPIVEVEKDLAAQGKL